MEVFCFHWTVGGCLHELDKLEYIGWECEVIGKADSVLRREGPRGCGICGTRASGCSG